MSALKEKQEVKLANGKVCKVIRELGRGGQGIVYLVEMEDKQYALKWYIEPTIVNSEAFYRNLAENVKRGSPAENFLWPLQITERSCGSYGYLMNLRGKEYHVMGDFLLNKVQFATVKAQLDACLNIVDAFQKLHIIGYSYQDMNDGNFFIDPKTGKVQIADTDNVSPNGTLTGVAGKSGYMAPEIMEGDSAPNIGTDAFSLAVCLFILIFMNRPFEGKWYLSCPCDNDAGFARKLNGYGAVFIMDRKNDCNRPVPGIHDNVIKRWPIYPILLKQAFVRTFGRMAMTDCTYRLIDRQWRNILLQARSELVKCPKCGHETFVYPPSPNNCVWCKTEFERFPIIKVGRFTIPMLDDQKIYKCQVTKSDDLHEIAAEVKKKWLSDTLTVKNCMDDMWIVKKPDGETVMVEKGESIEVENEIVIRFGNHGEEGIIKTNK